jgi:hypothetical protein
MIAAYSVAEIIGGVAAILAAMGGTAIAMANNWFARGKTRAEAEEIDSKTLAEKWTAILEEQRESFTASFNVRIESMQATIMDHSERIARQAVRITELEERDGRQVRRISELEAVNHTLDEDVRRLRIETLRFEGAPMDLRPMSDLTTEGWLDALNVLYVWGRGFHIRYYPDNLDGKYALGLEYVPLADVPAAIIAEVQARFDQRTAQQPTKETPP